MTMGDGMKDMVSMVAVMLCAGIALLAGKLLGWDAERAESAAYFAVLTMIYIRVARIGSK